MKANSVSSVLEVFSQSAEEKIFKPGQLLASQDFLPSQVCLITDGTARLLSVSGTKESSVYKLTSGDLVGACSFLQGISIEHVRASSDLKVLSLSDEKFLELILKNSEFRNILLTELFPAEVLQIAKSVASQSAKDDLDIKACFTELRKSVSVSLSETFLLNDLSKQSSSDESLISLSKNNISYIESTSLENHVNAWRKDVSYFPPEFPLKLFLLPIKNKTTIPKQRDASLISLDSKKDSQLSVGRSSLSSSSDLSILNTRRRFSGSSDQFVECFTIAASFLGFSLKLDTLNRYINLAQEKGINLSLEFASQLSPSIGFYSTLSKISTINILRLHVPSLLKVGDDCCIAVKSDNTGLYVYNPAKGLLHFSPSEILSNFGEYCQVLILDKPANTNQAKFGFQWFFPLLRKYKGSLIQVLVASLFVQIFGLANPLLIQVIIDKVITQRSLDTLQVLGIALAIVTLLESFLGVLKTFLFVETTNRIDQRLGAEVIDHLLRLPLGYFDKKPVGELSTRINELEKIRTFLTGQALTTIIDVFCSVAYIAVMAIYSIKLTFIALSVLPVQVFITVVGAPIFRKQYREAANHNAKTQSHLVEVLGGIQTVKTQNVETISRNIWQELYSKFISKNFERTITGTSLSQLSSLLQKFSQLLVLWFGATQVLAGNLTLGQLIAFRIISGYVTQPLLRLSTIWQNLQELRVSFERLADIIDTTQESDINDSQNPPLPAISGDIKFENVDFSFTGEKRNLSLVSLSIQAGTFVGIVGQSGSGKSTLTKLLARLYQPSSGKIFIDGYDISKVELYSLRRQIGIVPQDPLLFTGSVNDNLKLINPNASSADVITSTRLACAHEFIMDLSNGYSTNVGERGSLLSGGQRQRIAIARTLLANPSLLVMDEATSALDYKTEKELCSNLMTHLQGKTVLFVTHRLSSLVNAKLILVMHEGALVESGSHQELMNMKGRYYALYNQQQS